MVKQAVSSETDHMEEWYGQYWRRNLALTAFLLLAWVAVTFLPVWFATELNQFRLFGWPLGYFLAAQGAVMGYLGITWLYVRFMDHLDDKWGHPPPLDK